MGWVCKKCGGEIVEISIVHTGVVREIKKNGESGKTIFKEQHKTAYSKEFKCLDCGENSDVVYKNSLEKLASWKNKE